MYVHNNFCVIIFPVHVSVSACYNLQKTLGYIESDGISIGVCIYTVRPTKKETHKSS